MNDALTSKPRRRLRPWHVIAAAVAVSVAAIAAVYLLFFGGDDEPPLTLSTPGSTTQTTAAPGTTASGASPTTAAPAASAGGNLAGQWAVGANSVAGYRVREKLLRLPASNDAVGRTGAITGGFRLEKRGTQFVVPAGLRMEVDLRTMVSDDPSRKMSMPSRSASTWPAGTTRSARLSSTTATP